jgi:hypothetical protein
MARAEQTNFQAKRRMRFSLVIAHDRGGLLPASQKQDLARARRSSSFFEGPNTPTNRQDVKGFDLQLSMALSRSAAGLFFRDVRQGSSREYR